VYGVFNDDGREVTKDTLSEPDWPVYSHESGFFSIGSKSEWLDRRKGFITPYVYCPYCGEKLDWRKLKRWVKQIDQFESGTFRNPRECETT
jgi:hypothetical protein